MARTQKDTVSYFPHDADASGGDTLTVLEGQFGNAGYVFWFKLLERLASSDGHFIDCTNSKKWHLLLARARVDDNTGVEMMILLVEMGAIDKQLWECDRIIWCQNLVDNVAEVYRNRRRDLPQKPLSTGQKLLTMPENLLPFASPTMTGKRCPVCGESLEGMRADAQYCSDKCRLQGFRETAIETDKNLSTKDNAITTPEMEITTPQGTQSKVNETKVKETTVVVSDPLKEQPSKEEVLEAYRQNIGELSGGMDKQVELAVDLFSASWVADAIREALLHNKPTWVYIAGILKNWKKDGKEGDLLPGSKDNPRKSITHSYEAWKQPKET